MDNKIHCVLIIGRSNVSNQKSSQFDNLKYDDNEKKKYFTVNYDENEQPDFTVDFDDHNSRINLFDTLFLMDFVIDLIIFDYSTFKFMTNLNELFKDVHLMLSENGRFIFDYSACGGMITYHDKIQNYTIRNLNIINLPVALMNYSEKNRCEEIKNEANEDAQQQIKKCLEKIFKQVEMRNGLYPYYDDIVKIHYVCSKN